MMLVRTAAMDEVVTILCIAYLVWAAQWAWEDVLLARGRLRRMAERGWISADKRTGDG